MLPGPWAACWPAWKLVPCCPGDCWKWWPCGSLRARMILLRRQRFATPEEHLKLAQVPTYGTVVLRNTSPDHRLIVPMHIGFFQPGAQNHATSRALVLEAGETLSVNDCFCIQASQGGLLKEAQQRFVMLPLGPAAICPGQAAHARLLAAVGRY